MHPVLVLTLGAMLLYMVSCGSDYQTPAERAPARRDSASFASVKALVDGECVKCHNGSSHPLNLGSEAAFNQAKVKARIASGSMPPNKVLAPETKATLLSYFGS